MKVKFVPVRLAIDDEARLVYVDDRLLAVVTLHEKQTTGAPVHVESYFCGDAPDTFDSLDALDTWIRTPRIGLG